MQEYQHLVMFSSLKSLLNQITSAHQTLDRVLMEDTNKLHELIRNPKTWNVLWNHGDDVFEYYDWNFWRSEVVLEQLGRIARFLGAPSRQTLKCVLKDAELSDGEIEVQLALFDSQNAARQACLPQPDAAEVDAVIASSRWRLTIAMMHEHAGLGVTRISKLTGTARSTVYAAIEFYRELPEGMRLAIERKFTDFASGVATDRCSSG